ncbi:hypothetical protein AVEN_178424-1 [Araneus ventricosus]|uniref:Uncharacterized protein n=1 Tax=Araneus ventricosus TaxID=182803 RepID=A0A4Y2BCJ8_ARAVE|nr:hypothetical protein AVEN_178424-1 [Araneus ventricosus]
MSIFAGARKSDLKILAVELGETVIDSHKLKDLKKMILTSKECDEESVKEWLNTIINERKVREENEIRKEEIAERRRQDEIEIAERRRQEKIEHRKQEYEERKRKEEQDYEERKRKEEKEYEERKRKEEYEERKRKDEMEFELPKIRLGAEVMPRICANSVDNFCCIYGELTFAAKEKITSPVVKKAYHLYFGCKIGNQDKDWAPYVLC